MAEDQEQTEVPVLSMGQLFKKLDTLAEKLDAIESLVEDIDARLAELELPNAGSYRRDYD